MMHSALFAACQSLSDHALFRRFQEQGDQSVLWLFLQRHRGLLQQQLRHFPLALCEEDFLQDMYLLLFEKIPRQEEVRYPKAWLNTLAFHRLCDLNRRRHTQQQYQSGLREGTRAEAPCWDHELDRRYLVDQAFRLVNAKEADCLSLRYQQEKSYQEIADILGLTHKQVCGRLDRGLRKMRQGLRPG